MEETQQMLKVMPVPSMQQKVVTAVIVTAVTFATGKLLERGFDKYVLPRLTKTTES